MERRCGLVTCMTNVGLLMPFKVVSKADYNITTSIISVQMSQINQ